MFLIAISRKAQWKKTTTPKGSKVFEIKSWFKKRKEEESRQARCIERNGTKSGSKTTTFVRKCTDILRNCRGRVAQPGHGN